jgi:hypothetical protein
MRHELRLSPRGSPASGLIVRRNISDPRDPE